MKRIIKTIIPILFLVILFNGYNFVNGQDINNELKDLNKQIQEKKDRITKMQDQQQVYENLIQQKQKEKANIANQLAILENRLAKAALDIESAQTEIDRTNLEIKKVNLDIDDKNQKIDKEKEHIADVLKILQKQDDKSALEILLLNDSFTDFINQVKYLEDINSEVEKSIETLKEFKKQLEVQKSALDAEKKQLSKYKDDLDKKKIILVSQQENKNFILEQTKSSEKEYQKLLKLAKAEQEQASADIVSLEKLVRAKIAKAQGKPLEFNDSGFIWPVVKNVLTATFHDPDYPFRYIFEHPAVDIRAAQGTTVRAAASGYVAIAKDAGKGYSYIMIVHGNGLATVYGHVSKIYVSQDDYVVQGQTIALSGGLPGTNGAGRLTTGSHLHFEVRLNGVPVDPMEYLP